MHNGKRNDLHWNQLLVSMQKTWPLSIGTAWTTGDNCMRESQHAIVSYWNTVR